jgi:hypothetical protein
VLSRLGPIRPHLCLAVSLIDHLDPTYGDAPLGINSPQHKSAIFVSGVFCRVALMSLLAEGVPRAESIQRVSVWQSLIRKDRSPSELDALQADVDALKRLQAETAAELDALLPATLDRAFKGEL